MASKMPPSWENDMLTRMLGPLAQDGPVTCRLATGTPPVDWRAMFLKYAQFIKDYEAGYYLLDKSDWTPGEWAAITELLNVVDPV